MDCNKDEAYRAQEIAGKKLIAKDFMGAKRFAVRAQSLYPFIEGMPQLLATIDVCVAAEKRVRGETDWYGILGVTPQADVDTIRKQYRKLVLLLHPDKNKFAGADDAFKLVSEAWGWLSDDAKRAAYNQWRNSKILQRVPTPAARGPITEPGPLKVPVQKRPPNATKPIVKAHKTATWTTSSPSPASSHVPNSAGVFWTVCFPCKMHYAYHRVYLYQNLCCPNCQEPFVAVETAPPSIISTKAPLTWNTFHYLEQFYDKRASWLSCALENVSARL